METRPLIPSATEQMAKATANPTAGKSGQTAKDFEAVFLTQFVDQMMKTTGDAAFGGKDQAEMWRSFMSEAVAKHLVEQGGLGLSSSVEQIINAYAGGSQTPSSAKGTTP